MLAHFSKLLVEEIVKNDSIVYAQIPFTPNSYFDFEYEAKHLLTLNIDKKEIIPSRVYFEGYYPYYRHRDLKVFKNLLGGLN